MQPYISTHPYNFSQLSPYNPKLPPPSMYSLQNLTLPGPQDYTNRSPHFIHPYPRDPLASLPSKYQNYYDQEIKQEHKQKHTNPNSLFLQSIFEDERIKKLLNFIPDGNNFNLKQSIEDDFLRTNSTQENMAPDLIHSIFNTSRNFRTKREFQVYKQNQRMVETVVTLISLYLVNKMIKRKSILRKIHPGFTKDQIKKKYFQIRNKNKLIITILETIRDTPQDENYLEQLEKASAMIISQYDKLIGELHANPKENRQDDLIFNIEMYELGWSKLIQNALMKPRS